MFRATEGNAAGRRLSCASARQAGATTGTAITPAGTTTGEGTATGITPVGPVLPSGPKRFHGSVKLDPPRVGRDASQVAEEVIAHLVGLPGAEATVTLEIHAEVPAGAPENVVRIVTENSRTLRFVDQGFESE